MQQRLFDTKEDRGMHRRYLLKTLSAGALGACLKPLSQLVSAEEAKRRVKTVYVLYKCHLDVGFTDTERGVIRTYFNDYFPRAMEIAEKLRESGWRGTLRLDGGCLAALRIPGAGFG